MKSTQPKSLLIRSGISFLVFGFFLLIATGSIEDLFEVGSLFNIDVVKTEEGGVYTEKEDHRNTDLIITYQGPQDGQGRWHGWVTIEHTRDEGNEWIHTETVFMDHGVRQGISTMEYPDGRVEEHHYFGGVKISEKKSGLSTDAGQSAFQLMLDRTPWYLFGLEAFGFGHSYVESFTDTIRQILDGMTFDPADFDDSYDDAVSQLSETPYDSIIVASDSYGGSLGYRHMKEDELRFAVMDMYLAEGSSTYSHLESSYPNYIAGMSIYGISAQDVQKFCNDLDDTLSMLGPVVPGDPFFPDSVDARLFAAISTFLVELVDTTTEVTEKKSLLNHQTFPKTHRVSNPEFTSLRMPQDSITTTDVAAAVVVGMFEKLLLGDMIRHAVHADYRSANEISSPPLVSTGFGENLSATSVTLKGYVIDDGGAEVIARGIAWAGHYNPSLEDNIETSGTGTGNFEVTLEGLTEGATYFARTYATNSAGTSYGNAIEFVAESTVGIESRFETTKEWMLFPNPADDRVTIRWNQDRQYRAELTIFDLRGRIVFSKTLTAGEGSEFDVDVSGIPAGIYHVKISQGNSGDSVQKLIIAR